MVILVANEPRIFGLSQLLSEHICRLLQVNIFVVGIDCPLQGSG